MELLKETETIFINCYAFLSFEGVESDVADWGWDDTDLQSLFSYEDLSDFMIGITFREESWKS